MSNKEKLKETVKEEQVVKEGRIFAILAYFSILCLVPLILKRDNKFAVHHGKQGLVLFIGEVATAILSIIPFLGIVIGFLGFILFSIVSIIGIVQVLIGKYWKAPIISDIASKMTIP